MNTTSYIKREKYLSKIRPAIGKDIVKVIVGQRHVGKTTMLFQLMDEIKIMDPQANLIYLNAEVEKFKSFKTGKDLYEYLQDKLPDNGQRNYLIIDELQEVDDYHNTIRTIFNDNKCELIFATSNENLFSDELADFFYGKTITVRVRPLDYREFVEFHNLDEGVDSLIKYLTFGGLPFVRNLGFLRDQTFEYLKQAYYSIMFQGVVGVEKLRNASSIDFIVNFLVTNTGSMFTGCSLNATLEEKGVNMAVPVIINYLKCISNNFFAYKVRRTDFKTKIYGRGEKFFFEDLGMRNCLSPNSFEEDCCRILENAVFINLINNEYKVFTPQLDDKELSFMATKDGEKVYILTAVSIMDKEYRKNAISNFSLIESERYPKYIITLNDPIEVSEYNGIKHINIRDFLLMDI